MNSPIPTTSRVGSLTPCEIMCIGFLAGAGGHMTPFRGWGAFMRVGVVVIALKDGRTKEIPGLETSIEEWAEWIRT